MDVEEARKALSSLGGSRALQFSEDGLSFYDIKEIALVGDRVVMFPHLEMKENTL
jgi:hypothetical protein